MDQENQDDITRCKYFYKPCMNPRAIKRNGEYHSLCEEHRIRANSVQKSYAKKKRQEIGPISTDTTSMACKYVYKPCMNPRAMKRNGELHSLCSMHQSKANMCQKQYATKKRISKVTNESCQSVHTTQRVPKVPITLPPLIPTSMPHTRINQVPNMYQTTHSSFLNYASNGYTDITNQYTHQ